MQSFAGLGHLRNTDRSSEEIHGEQMVTASINRAQNYRAECAKIARFSAAAAAIFTAPRKIGCDFLRSQDVRFPL